MAEPIRFHRRYAGVLAAVLMTLGVAACDEEATDQAETPAEETPAEEATESGG